MSKKKTSVNGDGLSVRTKDTKNKHKSNVDATSFDEKTGYGVSRTRKNVIKYDKKLPSVIKKEVTKKGTYGITPTGENTSSVTSFSESKTKQTPTKTVKKTQTRGDVSDLVPKSMKKYTEGFYVESNKKAKTNTSTGVTKSKSKQVLYKNGTKVSVVKKKS